MIFTNNISQHNPINAFNDNIVEFRESVGVKATIKVNTVNNTTYQFQISGYLGNFYFNLKEVFKAIINQDLFSDQYDYNGVAIDYNAFEISTVEYKTYNADGNVLDTKTFTYYLLKSVFQIEDYDPNVNSFMHHPTDEGVVLDVFAGYPFDISFFHKIESLNSVSISTGGNTVNFGFSNQKAVYRIPLIDKDGNLLHQYDNSNYLSLQEGVTSSMQVLSSEYQPVYAKLNYHNNCKGVYLKWLNTYGGWDYWLFGNKHKVKTKDKSMGKVYTGFDNIQNLNTIESSLGKEVDLSHDLQAEFLNTNQFQRVTRLMYSPKVYMWTGKKFIEVELSSKNSFVANKQEGNVEFTIELPKRFLQTV
jgi:hypothetical protein